MTVPSRYIELPDGSLRTVDAATMAADIDRLGLMADGFDAEMSNAVASLSELQAATSDLEDLMLQQIKARQTMAAFIAEAAMSLRSIGTGMPLIAATITPTQLLELLTKGDNP